MDLGLFYIDIDRIIAALQQTLSGGAWHVVLIVIALGGWLVLVGLLLIAGLRFYEDLQQNFNMRNWRYTLLAIDIPALNVQTPKAVEQMFAQIAGAGSKPNLKERLKDGYKQRWFSFEIISIEGYIQFLVWTETAFRDLVEAAVYAQYPDAEITEVEDYIDSIPDKYPNSTHDIWTADFGLAENNFYPIRTYREFEHNISKDTVLKDPMGTFLESFTRIGPGEQLWFQILVEPIGNDWKEGAIAKVKELIGEKATPNGQGGGLVWLDHIWEGFFKLLIGLGDQIFGRESSESTSHEKDSGPPNKIQYLTPGGKLLVEGIELKISKLGFKTKLRAVYSARKEVFNPRRAVHLVLGAINQYNIPSANSIVPTLVGQENNRRGYKKKNLLIKSYRKRKINAGGKPCILNIEELATVWHFPMSHVKTPLVQKAASKQAEPPIGLPVERILPAVHQPLVETGKKKKQFTTDSGEVITYEDLF